MPISARGHPHLLVLACITNYGYCHLATLYSRFQQSCMCEYTLDRLFDHDHFSKDGAPPLEVDTTHLSGARLAPYQPRRIHHFIFFSSQGSGGSTCFQACLYGVQLCLACASVQRLMPALERHCVAYHFNPARGS